MLFVFFHKEKTTCFDGIKNGNEEGVDCGGRCKEVCVFKAAKLNVLLAQAFPVSDGVYNAVVLLENPNFSYNFKTDYKIKIYNKKGVVVFEHNDNILLTPSEKRAIFIPSIIYNGGDIGKVLVIFGKVNSLTRGTPKKNDIKILSKTLSNEYGQTKLTIGLENKSFLPLKKIEVVGLLSNKENVVVEVGKTFVNYLDKKEKKKIFMT